MGRLRSLKLLWCGLMWCLLIKWFWRSVAPPPQLTCSKHTLHTTVLRSRGRPVGSGSNPKKYHGLFCGAVGLLSSFSVPGIKSYAWETGDGKEIREEIMPESLAVSGFDIVVTSLIIGMGLCDWLWSDQREELLGSGRVTNWMSCRSRRTVSLSPTSHLTLSPVLHQQKTNAEDVGQLKCTSTVCRKTMCEVKN